jgi:uroporphyrinogen-III decarboxylase
MTIAEDMSYNNGPMISRAMMDEFLTPYYEKLLVRAKEMDMVTIVDTDGDVTLLVPWLLDNEIEGALPLERQAGVDGMALRQQFPKLAMVGHYNKMVMTDGQEAMRAEFERLGPLMKTGGFIPSVDHQTPPSVSLDNYRIYLKLLNEYTMQNHH